MASVQWFGSEALELTYKGESGGVANEFLYRHDEPRLQVPEHSRQWSFDGDGYCFARVSEAHRIRLAHLFDPVLAVHTSLVDPLPLRLWRSMKPCFRGSRCGSCLPTIPAREKPSWPGTNPMTYQGRNRKQYVIIVSSGINAFALE